MRSLARHTLTSFLTATLMLAPTWAQAQTTIYVDADAPPGGDGTTWATAYDSLSDALAAAQPGDRIWVAAGRSRFVDDPLTPDTGGGTPPIVDIGAYEHQPDWLASLEDAVLALELPHGIERSLLAKLAAASRAMDDDNPRNDVAACNAVRAFINALQALSGRHIPETEATALVEMAHQTLELLGCSDRHGRNPDLGSIGRERSTHGR